MSHLFDYLDWRGDLPLTADPFNVVDGVILARLAYMPFEQLDAAAAAGRNGTAAGSAAPGRRILTATHRTPSPGRAVI